MPTECHLPWTSGSRDHTGGGDSGKKGKDSDKAEKDAARKVKLKYSCPACSLNVWGRAGLRLRCDDCNEQLRTVDAPAADERADPVQKAA